MKTEKYRLYVAPFTNETIKAALDEPYARASKTHVLIYKKGKGPDGYKEMKDEDAYLLPASDVKWLKEVNIVLMEKFLLEHREKSEKAEAKFIKEFERELQAEREKLAQQRSGAK